MATIFKRSKKKNEPYTIQYLDHLGKRRTKKGFTDKGLTEQLAAKLETEVRLRTTGLINVETEQNLERQQTPLTGHIEEFKENLADKSPQYISHTISRLKKIVDGCQFVTLGDINKKDVIKFMKALRTKEDLGPKTYNHYLQAIDAFCNWCYPPDQPIKNPVAGMKRENVDVDIRHQRRVLTETEFSLLLQSARESKIRIQQFTGEQRSRIYILSYMTGLRRAELGSLMAKSFALDADPPTVTVEARDSKHRRKDVLPLHPDLVPLLREWLKGLKPTDKLFPNLEKKKAWFMVKKDLERVGIPYENEEGIADFHAAGRHTHITELLRNGASLPEAQKLARHSDIKMTMRYTHIGLQDQARAVTKLPTSALQMRCISGVSGRHSTSTGGNGSNPKERQNPCGDKGFDVDCRELSNPDKVEARGCQLNFLRKKFQIGKLRSAH